MKQPLRFFSIGLLTATVLIFGFYMLFDPSNESVEDIPVEELIASIESDGYRVITEDEFITYSVFIDQENQTEKASEDKQGKKKDEQANKQKVEDKEKEPKEETSNDEEKEDIKKVTFTTEAGVVSQDIADILVENNIIDDRKKFLDYLDDNGYSSYIQLGKFEVTSDMSFKEIAEIITTYPGN